MAHAQLPSSRKSPGPLPRYLAVAAGRPGASSRLWDAASRGLGGVQLAWRAAEVPARRSAAHARASCFPHVLGRVSHSRSALGFCTRGAHLWCLDSSSGRQVSFGACAARLLPLSVRASGPASVGAVCAVCLQVSTLLRTAGLILSWPCSGSLLSEDRPFWRSRVAGLPCAVLGHSG